MPKATKNIPAFAGGEISKFNPRDIPDEALSKGQDVMMDNPGKIRLMGKNEITLYDSDLENLEANVTPGYGLYTFRADKHIRLSGGISSTSSHTYASVAYTKITCSKAHKFAVGTSGSGAYVYIIGNKTSTAAKDTAFIKRHKILTVVDSTNFVIDLAWSSLNEDVSGFSWIWNPGWGIRPYYDIDGNYCDAADQDPSDTDRVYDICTAEDNPSVSDPIDGEFIYIAIQDLNSTNIYHYTYKVLLTDISVLTNQEADSINQQHVKPDMIYVNNGLRISDGNTMHNKNNSIPKWFGYTPKRTSFVQADLINKIAKPRLSHKGQWNVFSGEKDDVIKNESNVSGVVNATLEMPKDLLLGGEPATYSDYSGLQFQVSQYKTRDGSDADAVGGVSSLCDGEYDTHQGTDGTNSLTPQSEKSGGRINLNEGDDFQTDLFPEYPRQVHMVVCGDTRVSGDWQGASGSEHNKLKFGMAWVYGTKTQYQESKIFKNDLVEIKPTNTPQNTDSADAPDFVDNMTFRIEFFVNAEDRWDDDAKTETTGLSDWHDPRLIGASIYITSDSDGAIDDPLWLGTLYLDSNEGFIDSYGNKFEWKASWSREAKRSYIGVGGYGDLLKSDKSPPDDGHQGNHYNRGSATNDEYAIGCSIRRVPTLTYKLRNFGLEPYEEDQGQQVRWKTSVFAQNRLFVGNVEFLDGAYKGTRYPDRMLISPEVKYDSFPHDSYIDVQTNDGDQIIKLEYFKGKLLQFKRNILYVIDISGEFYFNEATHHYIGIKNPWSSTVTPGGIAWVNNTGLFIYDGSKMVNLIESKISNDVWDEFNGGSESTSSPMITYIPKDKNILIARDPNVSGNGNSGDVWIYDVETESFTFGVSRVSNFPKSNFTKGFNDKSIYGVVGSEYNESPQVSETVEGVFSGIAVGSFYFTGGATTNSVTLQYYKGDSSWTTVSTGFIIHDEWNSHIQGGTHLANVLKARIGTSAENATGDLYVSDIQFTPGGGMYVQLTAKTGGTALNTGNGDQTDTGYNSFKLTGSGTDWATTTDNAGTTPDIGTTNGITGWETTKHMQGGSAGVAKRVTVNIDRNSSTRVGVVYSMILKVYQFHSNTNILHELHLNYTTTASDNSDNNLATSISNTLKQLGEGINNFDDLGDSIDALNYVTIGSASSGAFTIESSDTNYKFDFNIFINGQITLEQFSSNSKDSRNMLMHTKEYDFEEPNVRKKIYKLYLTYKSNDTSSDSSSLSGVRVYYAINGSSTFHPMKTKSSSDSAGTASNLPSSTDFTQIELLPNPSSSANKPNKVYSIKFKICSEITSGGTVSNVDGFELNDMSVIYRLKSIK